MSDTIEAFKPADPAPDTSGHGEFARSILAGLNAPQKTIESKWLYDAVGSHLFDEITDLQEYYPTRTEIDILAQRASELSGYAPTGTALVEPGSGSSVKTRLILDAVPSIATYIPIDISGDHLATIARQLTLDYPAVDIHPVTGDFTAKLNLPSDFADAPKLVFFPGSTIGNFEVDQARALLAGWRQLQNVQALIVGVDLVKAENILIDAYDDAKGVTAAFNLNLLTRINRLLGANFDLDGFRHEARWNEVDSRIEMHLVSEKDQKTDFLDVQIAFAEGETIHTENSHKYRPEKFSALAGEAGWHTDQFWSDDNNYFGIAILTPAG